MNTVRQSKSTADNDELAATPAPGDGYVQSFARGLAVVRSFGSAAPEQTLSEVAERTGLTRAGARRILLTLVHLEYVETEGRLFRLTPKVLELGFSYLSALPIWTRAQPVMEDLVEELRQSCSAAVLDGHDIVYVVRVPAHKIMSINLGVGSRLPAYCTSMGLVLLSGLTPQALRTRLEAMERIQHTPNTVTGIDQLIERIDQIRQQGWALVEEELEMGLCSVAAPVKDRNGRVVAAINISGQANARARTALVETGLPKLLEATTRINQLVCN